MAETMKQYSSCAPANDFRKMSSYRECLCAILKLLADFGKEVGFYRGAENICIFLADFSPSAHANVFSILAPVAAELPARCAVDVLNRGLFCFFLLFAALHDAYLYLPC